MPASSSGRVMPITIVFSMLQVPLLNKYAPDPVTPAQ